MDTVFKQGSPEDQLALLHALFEEAPIGLAFWDTQLRYQWVNPALAAMNGRPPEEHVGLTPEDVLGPFGREVSAILANVLDSGEPVARVALGGEVTDTPGRTRHWQASYYPVSDAEGRVRGIGGVIVEVTDERRARAEAEAAQALLDAVFDASPVGMAFWDRDLRYVRINEAATQLNALPAEAHLGRKIDEVMRGPLGEEIVALLRRVLETNEPALNVELSGEKPGRPGELHARQGTYYPLPGPNGEAAGVGAIVMDVTARKRLDELRMRLLDREQEARLTAERARARAELLVVAGDALAASLDYDDTVRTVPRLAVPAIADCCALFLASPRRTPRLAAITHADPQVADRAGELCTLVADHLRIGDVVRTGRTATWFDLAPDALDALARDAEERDWLRVRGPRSVIIVPISARGRAVGAMVLMHTTSVRRYDEEDVLLAQAIANRAALALENARLLTDRTRIARTLQDSFLPPELPRVPGVDVAAGYFPAGEQDKVGGDFYDVFESEPGVYTIIVGDVAGKGAEAAALTIVARYTLRTASMLETSPVQNLRLLNDALLRRRSPPCTVLYGRLCPNGSGAGLTAAAAGHPPPLVRRRSGAIEELTSPGTLLGAVEEPRLSEDETRLEAGDLVLFYTDGATDVRGRSGVLGEGLLRAELAAAEGCGAADVVDRISRAVLAAQEGRRDDDLALLAVRIPPAA